VSARTLPAAAEPAGTVVARAIGWILIVPGSIALLAAAALMVEKVWLLEDPTHVPSCSIDAVLACGSVMISPQAEAFGFPNPILGVAGFTALVTFGITVVAGASLPRGLWLAIQAGVTFAVVFVHWLFFQSVYRIEALCPYCMVVWVATITMFVYVTLHNVAQGHLAVPRSVRPAATAAVQYHGVVLTVWFAALALLIGEAFWEYWRSRF